MFALVTSLVVITLSVLPIRATAAVRASGDSKAKYRASSPAAPSIAGDALGGIVAIAVENLR
jgi:hypothetical protein